MPTRVTVLERPVSSNVTGSKFKKTSVPLFQLAVVFRSQLVLEPVHKRLGPAPAVTLIWLATVSSRAKV